ncbi:MAG: DUF2812 domain-containing protein [Clostridiales bacterium]|nr:DUF2812 domain-containing protein [Clostridiales bacterium]
MRYKRSIKFFSIMQYQAEEEYLRSMHQDGWKFIKVSGLCVYRFEKCEPQDVIYRLDYNQYDIWHKDDYVQLFHDCGWEYLQDYVGYSYFRKTSDSANEQEEIFCDDESRLQMMSRVFKGRMLPLLIIFLAALLPQMVLNLNDDKLVLAAIFIMIMLLYVFIFIRFGIQYLKIKNR